MLDEVCSLNAPCWVLALDARDQWFFRLMQDQRVVAGLLGEGFPYRCYPEGFLCLATSQSYYRLEIFEIYAEGSSSQWGDSVGSLGTPAHKLLLNVEVARIFQDS